jgi:hypothetical protein
MSSNPSIERTSQRPAARDGVEDNLAAVRILADEATQQVAATTAGVPPAI